MEKLRQKARTPELKIMMRADHGDGCASNQSKILLPSSRNAGTPENQGRKWRHIVYRVYAKYRYMTMNRTQISQLGYGGMI